MKSTLLLTIACALASQLSVQAASFDTSGFGDKIGGWNKKGVAVYEFTNGDYRTQQPTVTHSPSGAMFVTTQIELASGAGKGAVSQLALTFSVNGVLQGIQIKSTVRGKSLDTGLVRRPEPTGSVPGGLTPTDEMVVEVFSRFDSEMKKVTGAKESGRADFFSRLGGNRADKFDPSAGLRHNVNLMLQSVRVK